jgi:hypothetical protein
MGRGLSPLQTTILGLAYTTDLTFIRGRVHTQGVYKALYGWEPVSVRYEPPQGSPYRRLVWDVETIGAATFNRKAAAVSRALRRLVARGLLKPKARRKYSRELAWELTPAGVKVAQQLSVNTQGGDSIKSPHSINR